MLITIGKEVEKSLRENNSFRKVGAETLKLREATLRYVDGAVLICPALLCSVLLHLATLRVGF